MNKVLYEISMLIFYLDRYLNKLNKVSSFALLELFHNMVRLNKTNKVFKKLNKQMLKQLEIEKLENYANSFLIVLHSMHIENLINTKAFKIIIEFQKGFERYIFHCQYHIICNKKIHIILNQQQQDRVLQQYYYTNIIRYLIY